MALSASATARKAVQDAMATEQHKVVRHHEELKAAALCGVQAKYDGILASKMQQALGDVAVALCQQGSLSVAQEFPAQLCIKPNTHIDSDVMLCLNPVPRKYQKHNNEMVLQMCYSSSHSFPFHDRPSWIAALKGCGEYGCKDWYHVVDPMSLADAVKWAAGTGGVKYGAKVCMMHLSLEQVKHDFQKKLQSHRALLLVNGVESQEDATPLTQERKRLKRVARLSDEE